MLVACEEDAQQLKIGYWVAICELVEYGEGSSRSTCHARHVYFRVSMFALERASVDSSQLKV